MVILILVRVVRKVSVGKIADCFSHALSQFAAMRTPAFLTAFATATVATRWGSLTVLRERFAAATPARVKVERVASHA